MQHINHQFEFVVIGGGLAGVCAAVTSARAGIRTALIQDRPVLGGNAGKEIRVTPVGADNCNFLYSRETGLIEEIFLKNLHDNPNFSYEGFDLVLRTLVKEELKLQCFYNTSVCEVESDEANNHIKSVKGYTVGSETWHTFTAPYFADCTGDATVAALSGAPFRIGVEASSEFNEPMCEEHEQPYCMGGSVQFHTIDTGVPKPFRKPAWVKMDLKDKDFGPTRPVCEDFFRNNGGYWWIELGGDLDTVHDTEKIYESTLEIVYATWDYLKNKSALKEELSPYELDWVSPIAGKRESRRVEGDHILCMSDIESQRYFPDAIAYGGWGFDHHPHKGFLDHGIGSYHTYHAGPYNIPLRSLYSRHTGNLFLAGRNISATHYGLSSTRVMFTTAQLGEAVGMAAVQCVCRNQTPRELYVNKMVIDVQNELFKNDHHIHDWPIVLPDDIAPKARISASTELPSVDILNSFRTDLLTEDRMMLITVVTDQLEGIELLADAAAKTTLHLELYQGPESKSTFPENMIWSGEVSVEKGMKQWIPVSVGCDVTRKGWHFLVIKENKFVALHTGLSNVGVCNYRLRPYDPIRPDPNSKWHTGKAALYAEGKFQNDAYCFRIKPVQAVYGAGNVVNEYSRPTNVPNLWISEETNFAEAEWLELTWETSQSIRQIDVVFDSMLDFHFMQKWGGYKRNVIPSLVKDYRLWAYDTSGRKSLIVDIADNFQRLKKHPCDLTDVKSLRLEVLGTNGLNRAQVYSLRVFE